MPMVVVITMPPPTIMFAPMAVVVVLAVPMPFVPFPAFAIVVVMRMRPVSIFQLPREWEQVTMVPALS